jgi:hypothetical protein
LYSLIGWPLTPPFAFTQAKYAPSMFSMSVKSVPGCLVLIAPSGIGVPAAATPGLVPHDDVPVDALVAALVLVLLAEVDEAAGAAAALLVLLLLLLPQPAMNSTPRTAAHDRPSRTRETWWYILTDLLLLEDCVLTRPRGFGEPGDTNAWPNCMQ